MALAAGDQRYWLDRFSFVYSRTDRAVTYIDARKPNVPAPDPTDVSIFHVVETDRSPRMVLVRRLFAFNIDGFQLNVFHPNMLCSVA